MDCRLLVGNPHARHAPERASLSMRARGQDEVWLPEGLEALRGEIAAKVEGVDRVVIVGGDGTLRAVVEAMVWADCLRPVALVPSGTGNDLARTLGIPLDADDAWRLLDVGKDRVLDLLEAETEERTHIGVNAAVGGPQAQATEALDESTKRWLGPFALVAAGIGALADLSACSVVVDSDDPALQGPRSLVAAAVLNGRTVGGGVPLLDKAPLDAGTLSILLAHEDAGQALPGVVASWVAGDPASHDAVTVHDVTWLTVRPDEAFAWNLDGDLLTEGPITFRVLPRAWRVLCP